MYVSAATGHIEGKIITTANLAKQMSFLDSPSLPKKTKKKTSKFFQASLATLQILFFSFCLSVCYQSIQSLLTELLLSGFFLIFLSMHIYWSTHVGLLIDLQKTIITGISIFNAKGSILKKNLAFYSLFISALVNMAPTLILFEHA